VSVGIRHRVLVVGGGFAGLNLARGLGSDDRFDVTPLLSDIEEAEPPA
jgi:NADH dehydrogenase FAD-containing subunit